VSKRDELRRKRTSAEDLDEAVYGSATSPLDLGLDDIDGTVDLDKIKPDPAQPRTAIPSAVRRQAGPTAPPLAMLATWHGMAFPGLLDGTPRPILSGEHSLDVLTNVYLDRGPFWSRLIELYGLALSIRDDGLTNEITVAPSHDGGYIIETGERRYLAFLLLRDAIGHENFKRIPARVVPELSVWRQAHENTNRLDYTPLEKAKQQARLLIAMWWGDRDLMSYEEAMEKHGHPLAFYKQAIDLNSRRGMGDRLLDAMGVKNRSSVTQYGKLLHLTEDEWDKAEREGLSLNDCLRIVDERTGTNYHRTNADNRAPGASSYVYHDEHNTTLPSPAAADAIIYDTPDGGHPMPPTGGDNPQSPQWTDPGQRRVDVEPTHTPVPGGRSGEDHSMIPRDHTPAFTPRWKPEQIVKVVSHGPGEVVNQLDANRVQVRINRTGNVITVNEVDVSPYAATRDENAAWFGKEAEPTAPPPQMDPRAMTDEEFEQPQRTPEPPRQKRIVQLSEEDAALVSRLGRYAEAAGMDSVVAVLAALVNSEMIPGSYGDALDALGILRHDVERALYRLNRVINMAHGYNEGPDA
jgi:hypothetical protein